MILPGLLPMLGLAVSLVLLDRSVDTEVALQPAAFAYGVPALVAGFGIALAYSRSVEIAVGTKKGFGRLIPVIAAPLPPCIFGAGTALILIGLTLSGGPTIGIASATAWWASLATSVGGVGPFAVIYSTRAKWDFQTTRGWMKTIAPFGWGGLFAVAFFGLAMVFLQEWIVVFLILGLVGFSLLGRVILFRVGRTQRTD
jgi:hypothetical protein